MYIYFSICKKKKKKKKKDTHTLKYFYVNLFIIQYFFL